MSVKNNTLTGAAKAAKTRKVNRINSSILVSAGACYMGGICPVIAFLVSHFQAPDLTTGVWSPKAALWLVTIGLLIYSAPLIAQWFSHWVGPTKAWGFVIAMETTMTFTDLYTAIPALLTLIALNGMILRDKFATD